MHFIMNVFVFSSYDEQMEELLDEAYEHYVARKEGSTKQRKRAKQAGENQLLDVWTSFQLFFSCSLFCKSLTCLDYYVCRFMQCNF